jgi:hypothetical protein
MGESGVSDYSFDERLKFGTRGEKMVMDNFITILKPFVTEWIYGKCKEHTQKQRRGIDFSLDFDPANFEVKTREYKYYNYHGYTDIALETESVVEKHVLGWVYTTTADVILYTWLDESRTRFVDGYIIIVEKLRECLENLVINFFERKPNPIYASTEHRYHTENFVVPVEAFPEGVLIRFDPNELNKIYMLNN